MEKFSHWVKRKRTENVFFLFYVLGIITGNFIEQLPTLTEWYHAVIFGLLFFINLKLIHKVIDKTIQKHNQTLLEQIQQTVELETLPIKAEIDTSQSDYETSELDEIYTDNNIEKFQEKTEKAVQINICVNGKLIRKMSFPANKLITSSKETMFEHALKYPDVQAALANKTIFSKIFVPEKMINFIVNK